MVSSTRANLIPYDRGQYPMLPLSLDDSLEISADTVERRHHFIRPSTAEITAGDPAGIYCNRYDRNKCWQYAADYQLGGRIDIYA